MKTTAAWEEHKGLSHICQTGQHLDDPEDIWSNGLLTDE